MTHEWWNGRREKFALYVSEFVLEEIEQRDPDLGKKRRAFVSEAKILKRTSEALELAEALVKFKAVPRKAAVDAAHIAMASVHKMNYLLTWNCKHIANAEMITKIKNVCQDMSYQCPVICTPAELMGGK